MNLDNQRALARMLAGLRRDGRQQSGLMNAIVPPDKETAYRVAQLVADESGWAIAGWKIAAVKPDIAGQKVVLRRNGEPVHHGTARDALDDPMVPLTWLANELSRSVIGLHAGQTISTGTLTGMLKPRAGDTFVADFGPFGDVTVTYA